MYGFKWSNASQILAGAAPLDSGSVLVKGLQQACNIGYRLRVKALLYPVHVATVCMPTLCSEQSISLAQQTKGLL